MGEIQLKEGATTPKQKPKQKAIWWRVLLAFFGGFLTFPLLVAGGAAIVGTVLTTRQVVQMAGGNPDDILGAKYQSQTILQSVMTILNEQKFETLEDVSEISPLVESTVKDLYVTLAHSILGEDYDASSQSDDFWENIKGEKFSGKIEGGDHSGESTSPLVEAIKNQLLSTITLESLFESTTGMEAIFNYFLYPPLYEDAKDEEGNPILDEHGDPVQVRVQEPKVDANGNIVRDNEGNPIMVGAFKKDEPYTLDKMLSGTEFFNGIVDEIVIGDIIPNDANVQILDVMSTWHIAEISTKINELTLGEIIPNDADIQILNVMSTWHIDEISSKINELTIGDVVPNESGSKIIETMSTWHLDEISTKINDVQISSLIEGDISDNALLSAVADLKVSELSNSEKVMGKILALKLSDVIEDIPTDTILYSFKDKTLDEIKSMDINNVYLADLLEKDVYIYNDSTAETRAKYNKVIGALIENERKDRFAEAVDSGYMGTYAEWLEADPENAKYKASVSTLTNYNSIKNIALKDVIDDDGSSKVLTAILNKEGATIGNMSSIVNTLYLSDVLEINNSSPQILKTLTDFQGMDGDNPTFGENGVKINGLDTAFDSLKLSDVLEVNESSAQIIKALTDFKGMVAGKATFGENGATISNIGDKVNTLKLSDVIDVNDSSPQIIKSLTDFKGMVAGKPTFGENGTTVNGLSDKVNTMKLSDVIDVNETSPQIIKSLTKFTGMEDGKPTFGEGGATVNGLSTAVNTLKLSDVVEVTDSSPQILKSLTDYKGMVAGKPTFGENGIDINGISGAFNDLRFNQVFTWNDCKDNNIMSSLWKKNSDGAFKITNIAGAMENVSITDVLSGDVYDDNRVVWKASEDIDTVEFDLSADVSIEKVTVIYKDGSTFKDKSFIAGTDSSATEEITKDPITVTGGTSTTLNTATYTFKDSIAVTVSGTEKIRSVILYTKSNTASKISISASCKDSGAFKRSISGMWWMLLTSEKDYDGEGGDPGWRTSDPYRIVEQIELGEGVDYSISNFAELVANMEYHMKNETLDALAAANIITMDQATRDKEILVVIVPPTYKRLGEFTLTEFIDYTSALIP